MVRYENIKHLYSESTICNLPFGADTAIRDSCQ